MLTCQQFVNKFVDILLPNYAIILELIFCIHGNNFTTRMSGDGWGGPPMISFTGFVDIRRIRVKKAPPYFPPRSESKGGAFLVVKKLHCFFS